MQNVQTVTDEKEECVFLNTLAICGGVKFEHNHPKLDPNYTVFH